MTMLLSAGGVISPERRSALFLAVVALAALAVSLMLAFASTPAKLPGANGAGALRKIAESRSGAEARSTNLPVPSVDKPPLLWRLLTPWALALDALAVLGMVAVLALRHGARRRRRAPR
jgi:hypothetical protein